MKKKTMKREKCSVKVAYGLRSQCDEGRWFRNQEQNKMEHMKGGEKQDKVIIAQKPITFPSSCLREVQCGYRSSGGQQ